MADWVIVVDDDEKNLMVAGRILNAAHMRVTAIKSGAALLAFLKEREVPDLILLDIKMPDMDGFETLSELRKLPKAKDVPVIFLTADDKGETEATGLSLGAVDFIKKPFVPEVLTLRVRHMIDLDHLQRNLAHEVEEKSKEKQALYLQIVSSLATAIDAKDKYTNGHSDRVAEYAREIARRFGYNEKRMREIYMMGLLHDVGKIGIPDAVINKPAKLTEEEFAIIKTHPGMGARILGKIKDRPNLSSGARWHHERYDGKGYPDGLKGTEIPEEARIIAVADAYDAMTSCRSYRKAMPQEVVRQEIEKGMGTQFDSEFANIMLAMIDEDTEYTLREL